jgi:hypothetical protein
MLIITIHFQFLRVKFLGFIILFETLQVLKTFNEKLGSKIISKEEFKEKENNINKFGDQKKTYKTFCNI